MATWTVILRTVLFFLSLAMLLASLALIAVGFWMRYDNSFDTDLKNVIYQYDDPKTLADAKFNIRVWLIVVFWSIIGLSLGAVVTAIFGMISSVWSKRRGLMITYLFLIIVLVVLEIGSGIAMLIRRNSLHDATNALVNAIYTSNSVNDIKIIQNTYSCCGAQNNVFNVMYCGSMSSLPYCDVTVFNSVDNTMMISGIIFLVVLILQVIATIVPVPVLISRRKSITYSYEPAEVSRF
ncbi:CRE-TSP-1 protein [Caenorhabditis remanei]|uniref:CRE-TSP-1 protein n=1 Tax=Caenorhabditis remanei TaxID=31234 RepID=E3LT17_CAERE|nr:CRE-TSP-1 protein [Caenorhabditis remanei]